MIQRTWQGDSPPVPSPGNRRARLLAAVGWLSCLLILPCLPGCGGCRFLEDPRKKLAEQKEKEKEQEKPKPKPNFEFGNPRVLPQDKQPLQRIKPGHWVGVWQTMRANNFDFQGQTTWRPVDKSGRQLPLYRTGYRMSFSRPLALPKQQQKSKPVEMVLFAPATGRRSSTFSMNLTDRGGRRHASRSEFFTQMEAHEYLLLVLAREPTRYAYLKVQNSVQPPSAGDLAPVRMVYYHVLLPPTDGRLPLPSSMLTATSMAYILWDDLDPNALSADQQDTLLDWLHWGGQLLISGPNSLDTLQGSFLEPFLPAFGEESIELSEPDLELWNEEWTAPFSELRNRPLRALRPWSGVKLRLSDRGPPVNTALSTPGGQPLLVERRVGRGRIVVSAFRLSEHDLIRWPGFDGFLNGCLLRRPPRAFSLGDFQQLHVEWGTTANRTRLNRRDPHAVTGLRLFSRDTGYLDDSGPASVEPAMAEPHDARQDAAPQPGIGGWNDFSAVSTAARETLIKGAGIEIPSASFVLGVLVAYLAVLVPLNWTIFRLIDRIEWAWVAAPLISLACAGVVIKLAELDIGFARSNTEIAVIEAQAGYRRAHVTRFNALYTSLSTPYTVTLNDPHGLVQPFAIREDYQQPLGTMPTPVTLQRGAEVELSGFQVLSNRTGMIHSEQMRDLGGPLTLVGEDSQGVRVTNGTDFQLQPAAVVRRDDDLQWQIAWLDPLGAGETASGNWEPVLQETMHSRWAISDDQQPAGVQLDLWPIVQTALEDEEFKPGEFRLIALARDQPLPGMTISPAAPQKRTAALLVAHLQYPQFPPPRRDVNTAARFQPKTLSVDAERSEGVEDLQPVGEVP